MKTKDILVVRLSKQFTNIETDSFDMIAEQFEVKFKKQFVVVVLLNENETNRTDFEIICVNNKNKE